MATVSPLRMMLEKPRKAYMPDNVAINAGTCTLEIQKPWNAPMARPASSITSTASHMFHPAFISLQPTAAVKHNTEPTDRSMLPPVRMQHSMPVASTNT